MERKKQQEPAEKKRKPNLFSEIHLLTKVLKPPVIFYMPDGGKTVEVARIYPYVIQPKAGEVLKKIDVMFALSKASLPKVKSGITINPTIKAHGNRTAEKVSDRPKIQQKLMASGDQKRVRCVMLTGHILRGTLRARTRYHLILEIAGEIVFVYRHGLLAFAVEEPSAEIG